MGQKQSVDEPRQAVAAELNKLYFEGFTNARVTLSVSGPEPSLDVLQEQLRVAKLCKQRDPLRRSLQYDLVSLWIKGFYPLSIFVCPTTATKPLLIWNKWYKIG